MYTQKICNIVYITNNVYMKIYITNLVANLCSLFQCNFFIQSDPSRKPCISMSIVICIGWRIGLIVFRNVTFGLIESKIMVYIVLVKVVFFNTLFDFRSFFMSDFSVLFVVIV